MQKQLMFKKFLLIAVIIPTLILAGCGSSEDDDDAINGGGGGGGGGTGSQCFPLTQGAPAIPFNGSGVLYRSLELAGGAIPYSSWAPSIYAGQSFGVMRIGNGSPGPFNSASGPDGQLSLQIQGTPPNYYNGNGTSSANVFGTVSLSPAVINEILLQNGVYTPYGTGGYGGYYGPTPYQTNQSVCISGIAIHTGLNGYQLTDSNVYLYVNGTNHGIPLKMYPY
jgi:hypothetical protein